MLEGLIVFVSGLILFLVEKPEAGDANKRGKGFAENLFNLLTSNALRKAGAMGMVTGFASLVSETVFLAFMGVYMASIAFYACYSIFNIKRFNRKKNELG
ncbi:hypothetical protein [Aureibacter tunicatorum]|uniref:Uncharacterized protein n=1 Tax=Aureibacter tunicatorum TaxID=866807 RepID=A0AAE3XJ35_9BACT|nr:hypothetical protein [Aureibacter tunicatorum]MDR6237322.1 hypothetical protein [Aureibacter tunicatorum]BDD06313.1 hypothetical protein AUTU_37960 [Aureibacter tunicatorum]